MNKWITWFGLSCKRQLKKPLFFILLFMMPFGMWMFHQAETGSSDKIAIALFADGDAWNEAVAETLTEGEHSFEFYLCESKEALLEDVASRKAECGYSFPAGLRERLREGDYRRSIRVAASPATVADKLSSETVFAGLFEVYGRELLREYSQSGEAFEGETVPEGSTEALFEEQRWQELEALYETYLENGSTFAFEYETANGAAVEKHSVRAVFPVRGIGAVFIFVMGLAAAITVGEDERRGLFSSVTDWKKRGFMMAQLSASVFLSCVSVFVCLLASGGVRGALAEAGALAAYGILTAVFSYALLILVKNPLVISGLIPFFILGSLTTCPIFADLSAFVPVLGVIRHFFLPYYYLIL